MFIVMTNIFGTFDCDTREEAEELLQDIKQANNGCVGCVVEVDDEE